jgi:hypothetical protein
MDTSEVASVLPAFFNGAVISLLFGILHNPQGFLVGPSASDILEGMPHGGPKAFEHVHHK